MRQSDPPPDPRGGFAPTPPPHLPTLGGAPVGRELSECVAGAQGPDLQQEVDVKAELFLNAIAPRLEAAAAKGSYRWAHGGATVPPRGLGGPVRVWVPHNARPISEILSRKRNSSNREKMREKSSTNFFVIFL